ncbi:hypothetical protein [Pandoraea sp. ISTKB]|uniref:hypothetical protein n=1 Tax=Pandoraea sp. ISTKB TaxID=1586708 RepID=UPI00084780CD|nr:hypothetical protein [Pandoraea sp. ISTKB]ODP33057.1 hypothetical protein A9762_20655 [Pandoraea sp. ISTKB]
MSLKIFTHKPADLLANIKKAIKDEEIDTWKYNAKNEFDHSTENWTGLCKFTVTVEDGYLHCIAHYPDGQKKWANDAVYGVYQGRFAEMLMNHFVGQFEFIAVGHYDKIINLTYAKTKAPKTTV